MEKGFIFDSGNFNDTAGDWPIGFTIWSSGKNLYNQFLLDVLELNTFEISQMKTKTIVNYPQNERLVNWLKSNSNNTNIPLATCTFQGNTVQGNNQFVTILSGSQKLSGKGSFFISSENIKKVTSFFAVRRLISGSKSTWENFYDDYTKPSTDTTQFENDSLVYSIFESKSNQKSGNGLKNEFFWISVDKMKELADQNGYDELYNDARTSSDRYVHKLLFGQERIYDKLSPDAKLVLDKATELVERSMELRQVMANDENHLNSWDAGYAQLKLVWKEYFQEDFKEFRQLYKNLEDRMRPLVYELGFLKK